MWYHFTRLKTRMLLHCYDPQYDAHAAAFVLLDILNVA